MTQQPCERVSRLAAVANCSGGAYTSELDWTWNTLSTKETEKQVIDGYNSAAGRTITWTWNEEGDKTGVTYPVSGSTLTYVRDDLGRVDVISRGGTQVVDYTFSGSRVLKKAYPGSHSLHTYDGYGRVTQIHHKDTSSGNTLAKFVYGYDKSHQVTSQDKYFYDDVNNTRITTDTVDKGDQYDYDGAKRLVTVLRGVPTAYIDDAIASNISNTRYDDLIEYVLDKTGNRLTRKIDGVNQREYGYNVVNEMTSEGGGSRTYYDNGTFKGSGASTDYKYAWDDHFAWFDAGARQFTWHYDAIGRQISRTKAGSGGANDIRIYYDGLDDVEVVSWISSTEALLRRMVYGERINELLEHTDVEANPDVEYYAHADKLDSVMLLVLADGSIKESYRYKEYGEPTLVDDTFAKLTTLASNVGNWKRYTGQEHALMASVVDPWQFYRARGYRADPGRFVQRDPTHYGDASNMYAYVAGAPLDRTDPTGKYSFQHFIGGSGAGIPTIGGIPGGVGSPLLNRPSQTTGIGQAGPNSGTVIAGGLPWNWACPPQKCDLAGGCFCNFQNPALPFVLPTVTPAFPSPWVWITVIPPPQLAYIILQTFNCYFTPSCPGGQYLASRQVATYLSVSMQNVSIPSPPIPLGIPLVCTASCPN